MFPLIQRAESWLGGKSQSKAGGYGILLKKADMKGSSLMKKVVAIGIQDFGKLREKDCFYIDKSDFIREWWEKEGVRCLLELSEMISQR